MALDPQEIRTQVTKIIGEVADLDPADMEHGAALVEDLGLDSLSLLEISVDVDYHFKLGLPEGEMKGLTTIEEIVDLVVRRLAEKSGTAAAG